jgi:hypothetical protein
VGPARIFSQIQNFIQTWFAPKVTLPSSKKLNKKYQGIGFNKRNNFCYCNIPIFKLKFELKFMEDKVC